MNNYSAEELDKMNQSHFEIQENADFYLNQAMTADEWEAANELTRAMHKAKKVGVLEKVLMQYA